MNVLEYTTYILSKYSSLGFPILQKQTGTDIWEPMPEDTKFCFENYDYKPDIPEIGVGVIIDELEIKQYLDIDNLRYVIYKAETLPISNMEPYWDFYLKHEVAINEHLRVLTSLDIVYKDTQNVVVSLLSAPNVESDELEVITNADDYSVVVNPTDLGTYDKVTNKFTATREGMGYLVFSAQATGADAVSKSIGVTVQEKTEDMSTFISVKNVEALIGEVGRLETHTSAFTAKVTNNTPDVIELLDTLEGNTNNGTVLITRYRVINKGTANVTVKAKKHNMFETVKEVEWQVNEVTTTLDITPAGPIDCFATYGQLLAVSTNADTWEVECDHPDKVSINKELGIYTPSEVGTYVLTFKAQAVGSLTPVTKQVTLNVSEEITYQFNPVSLNMVQGTQSVVQVTTNADSFTAEPKDTTDIVVSAKANQIAVSGTAAGIYTVLFNFPRTNKTELEVEYPVEVTQ